MEDGQDLKKKGRKKERQKERENNKNFNNFMRFVTHHALI